ncbi:MAG: hypothetical protein Q8M88_02650 [Phenylobacterium sp.]|uniref:hypothetical protein n=1 Tax=Phenylobacterium sp. TaxID=1871053 RepID=UPI0027365175|nr:hypothetical protein [Phenylobacterium sp.]MDP3173318.1 hypothetical protein [Phenylobacterium sp.]
MTMIQGAAAVLTPLGLIRQNWELLKLAKAGWRACDAALAASSAVQITRKSTRRDSAIPRCEI